MSTYQPGQGIDLLDLPNEILLKVADKVAEGDTCNGYGVRNLSRTCKRMQHLTESAMCQNVSTDLERRLWNPFAYAEKHRRHLVKDLSFEGSGEATGYDENAPDRRLAISCYPNIRRFDLKTWAFFPIDNPPFQEALTAELAASGFVELRECTLNIIRRSDVAQTCYPLELSQILKAPKLENLHIQGIDLRGLTTESPVQCPSLRELHLEDCQLDDESLTTLLSQATNLRYLDFELQSLKIHPSPGQTKDVRRLETLLQTLACQSPALEELHLQLGSSTVADSSIFKNQIDFSQLESLRTLSTHAKRKHMYARYVSPWRPTNLFDNLPRSLHCIKLRFSVLESIDLMGLAEDLLSDRFTGKSLPACLRRLELHTYEDHDEPLKDDARKREDRCMKGIDMFMTRLGFAEIRRCQRFDGLDKVWTAAAAADRGDDGEAKSGDYTLRDEVTGHREYYWY